MNWSLAARNLRRDRRRTIVTLLSTMVILSAILMFLSYIQFVDSAISKLVIYQDSNGHVQVYRTGGPENLTGFPARYSLAQSDQAIIDRAIDRVASTSHDQVVRHSAQLMGVGILHNGTQATGFLARGVQPGADQALREAGGFIDRSEDKLPEDSLDALLLTRQIAELVSLRSSDTWLQLSAASYTGRFNAIDAKPAGRFTTGIEAIENTGLKLPLRTLQSLYDTTDVSRVVIQLKDRTNSASFASALAAELDKAANGYFVVTQWDSPHVGQLYRSFMGFANTMFAFTGVVLLLIAVATVQHTISASVNDRLKEIGMLRAMGFSRAAVTGLFVRESLLLAIIGAVLSLLFVYLVIGTGLVRFETALPRLSAKVPVSLQLPFLTAFSIATVMIVSIGFAAWRTVRRVTRSATASPGPFSLSRLVAASFACFAVCVSLAPATTRAAPPSETTMTAWLQQADAARGDGAGYTWTSRVRSVEGTQTTDTTYAVSVQGGRGLVRVTAPARQAGEKILLDGRAMWYGKQGLRKPVSISPQQRLSGEAANGDIASVHYARDYTPSFVGESVVNEKDCYEILLIARGNQVTYDAIRYFIDKKTLLGVRADFMTASKVVFKTATFEYENRIRNAQGSIPFVSRMRIVNATFSDRYSEVLYSDISTAQHSDNLFRIDNLLAP